MKLVVRAAVLVILILLATFLTATQTRIVKSESTPNQVSTEQLSRTSASTLNPGEASLTSAVSTQASVPGWYAIKSVVHFDQITIASSPISAQCTSGYHCFSIQQNFLPDPNPNSGSPGWPLIQNVVVVRIDTWSGQLSTAWAMQMVIDNTWPPWNWNCLPKFLGACVISGWTPIAHLPIDITLVSAISSDGLTLDMYSYRSDGSGGSDNYTFAFSSPTMIRTVAQTGQNGAELAIVGSVNGANTVFGWPTSGSVQTWAKTVSAADWIPAYGQPINQTYVLTAETSTNLVYATDNGGISHFSYSASMPSGPQVAGWGEGVKIFPDFSFVSNPSLGLVTLTAGGSTAYSLTLSSTLGYDYALIQLNSKWLGLAPSGVTANFASDTVNLASSGGTGGTTLTVTASTGASTGLFRLFVTANSVSSSLPACPVPGGAAHAIFLGIAVVSPNQVLVTVHSLNALFKGLDPVSGGPRESEPPPGPDSGGSVYNSYQNSASTTSYSFQVPWDTQLTFSVSSIPSGWSFDNWWDDYGYFQHNIQSLTINVGRSSHEVVAFFRPPSTCNPPPLQYPPNSWNRIWCTFSGDENNPLGSPLSGYDNPASPNFDENWGSGTVGGTGQSDNVFFTSGMTTVLASETTYTIVVGSDDGSRLFIDGSLQAGCSSWQDATGATRQCIVVGDGLDHQFRFDYYERRGNAWVSFNISPPPGYSVTFHTNPSNEGSIAWGSCNGPRYVDGQVVSSLGSVTACYAPSGYTFAGWTCTDGLACSGSSNPTVVTVTGSGSITLNLKTGSLSSPVSTSLTASGSPNPVPGGTQFTVSGKLAGNGVGLGGKAVLLVFGWNIVSVTTAGDGAYTYTVTAPSQVGVFNVQVIFLGDYTGGTQYLPSTATVTVSVS